MRALKTVERVSEIGRHDGASLRDRWPDEFRDGARCGFMMRSDGNREIAGYPGEFHLWSIDRRNAWFAGFNRGWSDRLRTAQTEPV
jgi:hypothetical protein